MYPLTCTIQYIPGKNNGGSLSDFDSTVSIGGRPLCNLRFADDIDLIGRDEEELQDLTTRLE